MPATRGRRDTSLLEPPASAPNAPLTATRQFYCGKKTLTYLGDRYAPGERMPDSVGNMPRLETRISLGLIAVSYVMPAVPADPAPAVDVIDELPPAEVEQPA